MISLVACVCTFGVLAGAQEGIDPMTAPDWLPPLRPPKDGEPSPPLPEVVPGLVVLPEKQFDPTHPDASPGLDKLDSPEPEIAPWNTDPRKARQAAKAEGKYHVMALLGLSWSTSPNPSRLLRDEILNTAGFAQRVKEDFVLSYVDYVQNKNDWSTTHHKLKDYFEISGFPALVFFDSEGNQIGKLVGYNFTAEPVDRKFLFNVEFNQLIKVDQEAKSREATRREELAEKGFREWESKKGSTLFAKLIRANEKVAVFKDEDLRTRNVPLLQLDIADRTLIRRMVEAKHVPTTTARR